jgi:hypothetical protein
MANGYNHFFRKEGYSFKQECIMKYFLGLVLVFVITGCSTLPKTFTTEKIMKIKKGMKSEEILKMFGEPQNISQSVCGGNTGSTWTCTTWKYGDSSFENAMFTFSGEPGSYILNNFEVDRENTRSWVDY